MRKPLLFGRSNPADVDDPRSWKQGESEIYGDRDGDGQPSVRKIEVKRQVGALREQVPYLPADGEAQNATGRTDSPRRRFLIHASAFAERVYHRRRRFARFHEAHG